MHTTISDVHIIRLSRHTADLLVDGRPVAIRLQEADIDPHSRNLVQLPVDPAFYATLRGQQRADYLSAHVRDGVRYGRILWHSLTTVVTSSPSPPSAATMCTRSLRSAAAARECGAGTELVACACLA